MMKSIQTAVLAALVWLAMAFAAMACGSGFCNPAVPAPNHVYHGTEQMPLKDWVWVCHPDYAKLRLPKWWQYAILDNMGQLDDLITRLRKTGKAREEVEVHGLACVKKYYKPGWVLGVVDPCIVPGRNVLLITKSLTAADNGKVVQFYTTNPLATFPLNQ